MSRVYLIAADQSLPLCNIQEKCTRVMKLSENFRNPALRGQERVFSGTNQFHIQEHVYYRDAVNALELEMKPYQYALEVEEDEWGVEKLTTYLKENLKPGEQVELWSLWVGYDIIPPARYAGKLDDFALDTLHQFLYAESICLTITI